MMAPAPGPFVVVPFLWLRVDMAVKPEATLAGAKSASQSLFAGPETARMSKAGAVRNQ